MSDNALEDVGDALAVLSRRGAPEKLYSLFCKLTAQDGEPNVSWGDLWGLVLADSSKTGPFATLSKLVNQWDHVASTEDSWTGDTPPRSAERRALVLEKLGCDQSVADAFNAMRPIPKPFSADIGEVADYWYTPKRQNENSTYWDAYRDYLTEVKGWPLDSVAVIDNSSTAVVERLADPRKKDVRQTKGLVVGYVQSGKTANFSAVIAKAVDAGYRMVIVLTGMTNQLRQQTQRRLDMELVGVSNILGDLSPAQAIGSPSGEYLDDTDWNAFSRILGKGTEPSINRVTSFTDDVDKKAFLALDYGSFDEAQELFADYVQRQSVRLIVTKKNAAVLKHLVHALKKRQGDLKSIPVLLIDDESDQATPNTARPNWEDPEAQEHKKINQQIIEILDTLPRAQYLGYTATPFANVFINPNDASELFPKDYIIALDRPKGYMGAQSFIPTGQQGVETTGSASHPHPRVRLFPTLAGDMEVQSVLTHALACYVVTGAIKLFRANKDPDLARNFRHHTMLVHSSHKMVEHASDQELIRSLWRQANWRSQTGQQFLRNAYRDIETTLDTDDEVPDPTSFDELLPFLEEAQRVIETDSAGQRSHNNVTIVVNSDQDFADKLDFTTKPTWKIVIGGNQLSRGFTVEGLTISWFARAPKANDTLTQMARWFGFRPAYGDLVRLFLPDLVKISNMKYESLYEAFCAAAESEEAFRGELRKYASFTDGEDPIRPIDVIPLVYNFLGWMKPAAGNKMQWAEVKRKGDDRFSPKNMSGNTSDLAASWPAWQRLLEKASQEILDDDGRRWFCGLLSVDTVTSVLRDIRWQEGFKATIASHASHFEFLRDEGRLDDFLLLLPQLKGSNHEQAFNFEGVGMRSYHWRKRSGEEGRKRFGEYTEESQRDAAQDFALRESPRWLLAAGNQDPARGAILAYPIPDAERIPGKNEKSKKEADKFLALEGNSRDFTVGLQFFTSLASAEKRNAIAFGVNPE